MGFVFVVLVLTSAPQTFAQLGFILGEVVGEDGKPIEDVKIRIEDMRSSRKYRLETNDKGEYVHAGIYLQGLYRVIAEKDGYQGDYAEGIRPGSSRSDERGLVNFTLRKGAARRMAFEMSKEEIEQLRKEQAEVEKRRAELEKVRGSFNQAVEYYNAGQYEQAVVGFQEVLQVDSEQPTVWANLASTYTKLNQNDKAIEAYTKAIELDPENSAYLQNLGSIYAAEGDSVRARELYEKAASMSQELNPSDAAINYYNMGVTYINAGDNEKAAEALHKAIELDPNHGESHYQLGITLIGLNDMEGAVTELKKYLEIDPNGQNAEVAKALIEQLGG
jgi:tetratricopeptide (TPR) repeat protein